MAYDDNCHYGFDRKLSKQDAIQWKESRKNAEIAEKIEVFKKNVERLKEEQLEEVITILIANDAQALKALLAKYRDKNAKLIKLLLDTLWDKRINEKERKFLFFNLTKEESVDVSRYIMSYVLDDEMAYSDAKYYEFYVILHELLTIILEEKI